MIRHSSLTVSETLETLDALPYEDQEEALKAYLTNSASLSRFLQWYIKCNLSPIAEKIDYKQAENPWTTLSKNIRSLEDLPRQSEAAQIKFIEELLSNLPAQDMMLMENILTRGLREYYPHIDWELMSKYIPGI